MELPEINSARWLDPERFKGEKWKKIIFLPNDYSVSNYGRVKKERKGMPAIILYSVDNGRKYYAVSIKHKKYYLHRLVGFAFVENPYGYNEIDHINGDRVDNRSKNIRWVTHLMNMNNPHTALKVARVCESNQIPVEEIDEAGNVLRRWQSIRDAALETGINKNVMARISKNSIKRFRYSPSPMWVRYRRVI